jgi:hypothetical protein
VGGGGWGFGAWGRGPTPQPPIPNPQSPIPNPHFINLKKFIIYFNIKYNKTSIVRFKNNIEK